MSAKENCEKEFIIPTRYKTPIGSYLSWPVGAMELTKAFLSVPQIKELELTFSQHYPAPHQGNWPARFSVIEARYVYPRTHLGSVWAFHIFPVPRNRRSEIRKALLHRGFDLLGKWLIGNAGLSGRAGNVLFNGVWNSELKDLSFESRDYPLPEISTAKGRSRK